MSALLTVIVLWLSVNFDLPASKEHPTIAFVPPAAIVLMRTGGHSSNAENQVVAVYNDLKNTIFLPEGWTGKSPAELSILVHELVHHLQRVSGLRYECPAAREKLAYEAQDQWLRLFGRNLLGEFAVDPMTLKLRTSCFH